MDELKPCPFCGCRKIRHYSTDVDGNEYWTVECEKCGARITYSDFFEHLDPKADTLKAWNTRKPREEG